MQDIKIRRPLPARPHHEPVTPRETEKIVREVFQQPHEIEKPLANARGSWKRLIAVALIVAVAALVVSLVMDKLQFFSRQQPAENGVVQQPPALSQKPLFDSSVFYGVRMADGSLYFGRVTEVAQEHYRLVDVFYEKAIVAQATSTATSSSITTGQTTTTLSEILRQAQDDKSNKITLVKFGTEEYQPEDELYVPREKVKEIFPLSETSAILRAIRGYLNGAE